MADDDKEKDAPRSEHEHEHHKHEVEPEPEGKDEAGTPAEHHEAKPKAVGVTKKLHEWWQWALAHKKFSIPGAVVVLLLLVFAVPFTRYSVLALVLKQNFEVLVIDSRSERPVSGATVELGSKKVQTDGQGKAAIHSPVGYATLTVTKTYYESVAQQVTVPVKKPARPFTVKFEATGRPVPITITNKVSGKALAGVTITAGKSQAKTDDKGQATLVIPVGVEQVQGALTAEGYNKAEVTIKATIQDDAVNHFSVTPVGKLYFLSNQSGKIDLMKSNLDGTERVTVLAGTGKEDRYGTVLLASRDWKYIALLSKRDGGEYAKLFLIEAENDKVTTMDEGKANFSVLGWSGDRFVYRVDRYKPSWEGKGQALKSYQASTKKITTLDETTGTGNEYDYVSEFFDNSYVIDQTIVYVKGWSVGNSYGVNNSHGKQVTFNTVRADGTQKKVLKGYTFPGTTGYISLNTRSAEFGEIYIQYYATDKAQHDEYKNGKVSTSKLTDDEFNNEVYPSFVVSPSGKKTLWSDYRDGKYVFFVGDENGENGKQIGESEDFTAYGWYSDDYILLTKKSSEMRIMPAGGLDGDLEKSLKVGNYYKPNYYLRGYGYGYGG